MRTGPIADIDLIRRINKAIEDERDQNVRDVLIDARTRIIELNDRLSDSRLITLTFERYQELVIAEDRLVKLRFQLEEFRRRWKKYSLQRRSSSSSP